MTILSADTDSGVYGVGLLPGAAVNGGCYQLFGGCTGGAALHHDGSFLQYFGSFATPSVSGKLGVEGVEAGKGGRGEFRHGGYDSFEWFLFHVTAFGVEFVGIADEAFKQGFR